MDRHEATGGPPSAVIGGQVQSREGEHWLSAPSVPPRGGFLDLFGGAATAHRVLQALKLTEGEIPGLKEGLGDDLVATVKKMVTQCI